ncbi:MAG: hypothetical protein IKK38_11455 [Spirochaetaceae bacterium]|nr:hypothetical protein [Spirochaetaceae bacterium]
MENFEDFTKAEIIAAALASLVSLSSFFSQQPIYICSTIGEKRRFCGAKPAARVHPRILGEFAHMLPGVERGSKPRNNALHTVCCMETIKLPLPRQQQTECF